MSSKTICFTIGVLLLGTTQASSANSSWQSVESKLSSYQKDGKTEIDKIANLVPSQNGFFKLLKDHYCDDFDSRGATTLWPKVSSAANKYLPNGRKSLVEGFAALARACSYSQGATLRAAFLLDYMYWNRIIDTTGKEVADALYYRDLFYSLHNSTYALELIKTNENPSDKPVRDYLGTGVMSGASAIRTLGKFFAPFNRDKRKVVDAVTEILDLHSGSSIFIYGKDMRKIIDDPDDTRVMNEIFSYLLTLQKNPRLLGEAHGGWKRLIEITGGDRAQIVRLLGVLASMRYWPLGQLGKAYAARGMLKPDHILALYQGSMAYFILNQLDERSAFNGDDETSLKYQFFYPPQYTTTDWKIYHFYGNAHLGCELVKRNFSRSTAVYGAKQLALAYEAVTLNLAGPEKTAQNVEPRIEAILEGYDDVKINTDGAEFGARVCGK